MKFLYLLLLPYVSANIPIFDCIDCILHVEKTQKLAYIKLNEQMTKTIVFEGEKRDLKIYFSEEYDVNKISIHPFQLTHYEKSFNPFYQTIEYLAINADTSIHNITITTSLSEANILIKYGDNNVWSALRLLTLPYQMYNVEFYWKYEFVIWLFLVITSVLAVIDITLRRFGVWQAVLAFSIVFYISVCSNVIYRSIRCSFLINEPELLAFSIGVIGIISNGIPTIMCLLFIRYGPCRQTNYAILGIIFATLSLFSFGSGWFIGPLLLYIASIIVLLTETCPNILFS